MTEIHNGTDEYTPEQVYMYEMIAWGISGGFTFLSLVVSLHLVYMHLANWTNAGQQRYIVRLLLMVPIYGIDSWASLRWKEYALYFDIFRDCYEAYVIYQFYALLTAYIEDKTETDKSLETILEEKLHVDFLFPLCCLTPIKPSALFVIVSKQCILQYMVIKPLSAIIAAVLHALGLYVEGSFWPNRPYVYIVAVTFASVSISMYFLVWFYFILEDELKYYKAVAKFLCIKSILFFAFWQGVFISILTFYGVIPEKVGTWTQENIARGLQDFIITIEMFILAIAHEFVFSYKPYKNNEYKRNTRIVDPVLNFAKDVVNQKDMVKDMKDSYHPKNFKEAKQKHKESNKKLKNQFLGDPSAVYDENKQIGLESEYSEL